MLSRPLLMLIPIALLAGCGGTKGGGKVASASAASTASAPAKPQRTVVRAPAAARPALIRPQAVPGLEGVIGAGSDDLVRQFGPARLDVWEGDARKLQFSGTQCVLDIYLYPVAQGREAQASHVEARRASDGEEVDRIACVTALRKR